MGFPHLRLLRELRQSVHHRGRAPLTFDTDLPRFIYLDSNKLVRLPVAIFNLACCKMAQEANRTVFNLLPLNIAYISILIRESDDKLVHPSILVHCL